jgi:hypothetical protein
MQIAFNSPDARRGRIIPGSTIQWPIVRPPCLAAARE